MEMKKIVEFRGPRKRTKGWSPDKKFREFAAIRVPKLLKALKNVQNLSTVYNPKTKIGYTYREAEKKKILKDVKEAYQAMTKAWDNAGKKIKENEKKSYWDE
tara:strand:- start:335 stop:640 length:306 start_codon:yes stop_codon:yes gene_type:complete